MINTFSSYYKDLALIKDPLPLLQDNMHRLSQCSKKIGEICFSSDGFIVLKELVSIDKKLKCKLSVEDIKDLKTFINFFKRYVEKNDLCDGTLGVLVYDVHQAFNSLTKLQTELNLKENISFNESLDELQQAHQRLREKADKNFLQVIHQQDAKGYTALHHAVVNRQIDEVKKLIGMGALLNLKDESGETAFYKAAESGFKDVAELLLDAGADPTMTDEGEGSPFVVAAFKGHLEIIQLLVDRGINIIEKNSKGESSLDIALSFNLKRHKQVREYLIALSEDLTKKDAEGRTSLHRAVIDNDLEKVHCLLNQGSNLKALDHQKNSALHFAVIQNNQKIVELLGSRGAKMDVQNSNHYTPLDIAKNNHQKELVTLLSKLRLIRKDKKGHTLLHHACIEGENAKVEQFLNEGADIGAKNYQGATPLHLAAYCGQFETVRLLVKWGANVLEQTLEGDTPLHLAAIKGFDDVIEFLLNQNKDALEMQNVFGNAPLHLAALNCRKTSVMHLVSQGAQVGAKNKLGVSPFYSAVAPCLPNFQQQKEIVEYLLEQGALVDEEVPLIGTALQQAAALGDQAIIELLISKGADINRIDKNGDLPFIMAFHQGHKNVSDYLFSLTSRENQDWLYHKMLNHRFGINIQVTHDDKKINLWGLQQFTAFHYFTESIAKNVEWLKQAPANWHISDTQSIVQALEQAARLATRSLNKTVRVNEAIQKYKQQQLLIVPSGVQGHAVTISLFNGYLAAGDRGLNLMDPIDSSIQPFPHLSLKKINDPSRIDQILNCLILTNNENVEVDYISAKIFEDLNAETLDMIEKQPQHGKNCCWVAAKTGFEQALLLYLFNKFMHETQDEKQAIKDAKYYARRMFKAWVKEDKYTFLNEYIQKVQQNHPRTAYILGCIYHHLSHKKIPDVNLMQLIEKECPQAVILSKKVVISKKDPRRYRDKPS